jgi:hypothetical protein
VIGTNATSVLDAFRRVAPPQEPDALRIVPLVANASIGVFGSGAPAIFFELAPQNSGTTRTVARGVNLIVSSRFEVVASKSKRARTRSGYAVVLREPALAEVFAAVVAHIASRLDSRPSAFTSQTDVDKYLAEWLEFFSSQALSLERVIGLWGELYVLSELPVIERGVACWVGPYGQMFDYMGNGISLEVKTSLRTAVASFSLDQIENRDDGHSVFVGVLKDDTGGRSLDQLVTQIRGGLPSSVQFDATLVRAGYRNGANADMRLTAESVRAVPNVEIPRPVVIDKRIRSVRYEIDVDGLRHHFVPAPPLFKRLTARPRSRR